MTWKQSIEAVFGIFGFAGLFGLTAWNFANEEWVAFALSFSALLSFAVVAVKWMSAL